MVLIALLVCWLVGEKGLMPSAMTIQRPCGRNIAGCASCMPRTVFSWENCARIGRMIGAVLYGGERGIKKQSQSCLKNGAVNKRLFVYL